MVRQNRLPQNPMAQLRREMDRLISGLWPDGPEFPWPGTVRNQPAVNLWETADALQVEMEVPGVKGDQMDISVVGNQLAIKIDRPEPQEEGVTYHRRERPVGAFTRLIELPSEVDADKVQAELTNGVLLVTLPKAEAAKPHKIHVSAK